MLNSEELYQKIDDLRIKKGWTKNKLCIEAGISHGTLNAWRVRGTIPTIEILSSICEALNYSLILLLSGINPDLLTGDEIEMLSLWRKCNNKQRELLLKFLKGAVNLIELCNYID